MSHEQFVTGVPLIIAKQFFVLKLALDTFGNLSKMSHFSQCFSINSSDSIARYQVSFCANSYFE